MLRTALRDRTQGKILHGRERRKSGRGRKGAGRTEGGHDGDRQITGCKSRAPGAGQPRGSAFAGNRKKGESEMAYTVNQAGFGRLASCMDRARRGQNFIM